MYILYTSAACPKGVQAQRSLQARRIPFRVVSLDDVSQVPPAVFSFFPSLEQVTLPFLTRTATQGEEMVQRGFWETEWEKRVI